MKETSCYINKKASRPFFIFFLFFTIVHSNSNGQSLADRLEADYSIKEIMADGKKSLTIGKVFFDRSNESLTHFQTFPAENKFVFKDSTILLVHTDSVTKSSSSALSVKLSIYNLILSNNFSDLGLEELGFELADVRESEEKIVSIWQEPSGSSGSVSIVEKEGMIDGVIFSDASGTVRMRQFFRDYEKVGRIFFPKKIYEEMNTPIGLNKKITTHKNIKTDDFTDEEDLYNLYSTAINQYIRAKSD